MEIKYGNIVKMRQKTCKSCFTLIYHIPCEVDASLANYLTNFGTPKYDLNKVKLFRIMTADNYTLKTRLKSTVINLSLPKELQNTNIQNNTRKQEFEEGLTKWLENKMQIKIVR